MKSEIVNKLMFDYDLMNEQEIIDLASGLPNKILRWLGEHHPDNRTRKVFFRLTNVTIGTGVVLHKHIAISDDYEKMVFIGDRVAIGNFTNLICSSAPNNSKLQYNDYVAEKLTVKKPIYIGNDVWIGMNVTILPGVTIGSSSIVGSGSIVTRDVEPNTVVAGNPAKLIRKIE